MAAAAQRYPSLFISHGAPSFALEPGVVGPKLAALGRALPTPQAVLIVSPHWMTSGVQVGNSAKPETVHDFGGFAPALYTLDYPASGHPALAQRARDVLHAAGWPVQLDAGRGLDHGAWVPLMHLYPHADVPVFQVSLPARMNAEQAWGLGQALMPLAEEEVLIIGSGSLTHNLYEFRSGHGQDEAYAQEFSAWVGDAVRAGDAARLRQTLDLAPHAQRAHPTTEHFFPLLVAAGAGPVGQPGAVIEGGIMHGVLSMDAFVFGSSTCPTH